MPGTASHGQLRCAYPYIKCPAVNRCIDEGWTCDGDDDCGDASDENPAFCGTPHCLYGCIGSRLFQSGRIRTRTASELNTKKLGSGSGVLDYYALPYFTYLKSQKNTCAHLFGSGCERGCVHDLLCFAFCKENCEENRLIRISQPINHKIKSCRRRLTSMFATVVTWLVASLSA